MVHKSEVANTKKAENSLDKPTTSSRDSRLLPTLCELRAHKTTKKTEITIGQNFQFCL